jgi:hypothetical protein
LGRHRVQRLVSLRRDEAFDAWVDPFRAPQWQEQLVGVVDVAPDVATPGATFRLDYGPGMKREATVLTSRRGDIYRVRATGLGYRDEATVTFEATDGGTLITYDVDLSMGWGPIGKLFERRLGVKGVEKKMHDELDRFVAVTARTVPPAESGQFLGVDCGGRYRVAQLLADEGAVVHVRVVPFVLVRQA